MPFNRKARNKRYQQNHQDEIRIRKRNYYQKNKQWICAHVKKYRDMHKNDICVRDKIYNLKNKEKIKIKKRADYLKNKDVYLQRSHNTWRKNKPILQEYHRKYAQINVEKINARCLRRYHSSLQYRVASLLRTRLLQALKRYGNGKKFKTTFYGVNISAIIKYLGSPPNDDKQYHIDHIRPLCSFDLTQPEEIKKAFAPENHRWLEAHENLIKASWDSKQKYGIRDRKNNEIGGLVS